MVTIQRERLTPDLVKELRPLAIANHAAVRRVGSLDPDWMELHRLDRGDAMAVVVLRVDGLAVGYVAHVATRQHLTGEVWATCLALFVDECFSDLAWRLVRAAEGLARKAGAVVVAYNAPQGGDAARFLQALRYQPAEVVLTKRLDAATG